MKRRQFLAHIGALATGIMITEIAGASLKAAGSREESEELDHMDGYEREASFHDALCLRPPNMKATQLKEVIRLISPAFLVGLFEYRPCVRRLRYVGTEDIDDDFRLGEIYESVSFNGGTYIIANPGGRGDRVIGCAYFERIS
jgi:hypothetical protein